MGEPTWYGPVRPPCKPRLGRTESVIAEREVIRRGWCYYELTSKTSGEKRPMSDTAVTISEYGRSWKGKAAGWACNQLQLRTRYTWRYGEWLDCLGSKSWCNWCYLPRYALGWTLWTISKAMRWSVTHYKVVVRRASDRVSIQQDRSNHRLRD